MQGGKPPQKKQGEKTGKNRGEKGTRYEWIESGGVHLGPQTQPRLTVN